MNAIFTPVMRASLLADATRGATLKRWSIRELLRLDFPSGRDWKVKGDDVAGTREGVVVEVESLLREIKIRLAMQHSRLKSLSNAILGEDDDNTSSSSSSSRVARGSARESNEDAVNASRHLRGLLRLHENTYLIPQQVIDGDHRGVLEGYATRPNDRRYVAGVFDEIMSRHGSSVETLADAVICARRRYEDIASTEERGDLPPIIGEFESNIESFLHSRLVMQLLCDHYTSMHKGRSTGAISLDADVSGLIDDASTEAKHVCDANLGVAPEVVIRPDDDVHDDYRPPPIIRPWLHHAIVEVTKNAMNSNVIRWQHSPSSETSDTMPPDVHISFGTTTGAMMGGSSSSSLAAAAANDNPKYLRILIRDVGMGIKDEGQAFGFARSSSQVRWDRLHEQQSYAAVRQPLASLGVGLTLSRLMLRAFGGDLYISNNGGIIGNGCTATLFINYDDTHAAEN
jgi:pyruvate dehydrogenase kinase 2/3/4